MSNHFSTEHTPRLSIEEIESGLLLRDDRACIAKVKNLQLFDIRFFPNSRPVVGQDIPVRMFWIQYANHQNPERNAGFYGKHRVLQASDDLLVFQCQGYNRSRSIKSIYTVRVGFCEKRNGYFYHVDAGLFVLKNRNWPVSYNPYHGEIEFCNFYPTGAFITAANKKKNYQACYLQSEAIYSIPHHHLESSDKHNIPMQSGDRLLYMLEDINPVIELCSSKGVNAGLCAYMWDIHLGYRVCVNKSTVLPAQSRFEAGFDLYALDRDQGKRIAERAQPRPAPEIKDIPIYTNGVNRFDRTIADFEAKAFDVWAWSREGDDKAALYWDRLQGYQTSGSLCIQSDKPEKSRWLVTTLGPAFGDRPFQSGHCYRLTAFMRAEAIEGEVCIAIRYHLAGEGTVFDLQNYKTVFSERIGSTKQWHQLRVVTPPLSPPPDRMHIILQQSGKGRSWFDEVLFERLE